MMLFSEYFISKYWWYMSDHGNIAINMKYTHKPNFKWELKIWEKKYILLLKVLGAKTLKKMPVLQFCLVSNQIDGLVQDCMQYLQCISNGDAAVLHYAIKMRFNRAILGTVSKNLAFI